MQRIERQGLSRGGDRGSWLAWLIGPPVGATLPVWDIGVRAFHWLLVVAVTVAAVTGFLLDAPWLALHLIAGTAIAVLIGARLVWGLLGSSHARFASFAYGPRLVLAHLQDLRAGRGHRHLGHNPLGALMVFGLLLVLAAILLAGTAALGGTQKQGPLAAFVSYAAGRQWLDLHQALAIVLLGMVAAHIGGVVFESWRSRESLLRAMLTGRKEARQSAATTVDAPPERPGRPFHAAAIVLTGGAVATLAIVLLGRLPVPGLPPAQVDATYATECGACHFAYPPSLAPAATWAGIMAHLDAHFGEDASLPPASAAAIAAYLQAGSAEHADTLAANRLRITDQPDSLRITATPGWQRMHREIPDRVFAARQVGSRGACNACHRDAASGRFAPQSIELPEGLP